MTPADLTAARKRLQLTAAGLGRALELGGEDPGRSVRLWEAGRPIPGPARVAIRYMLAERARQSLQDAVEEAQAILAPTAPPAPAPEPPEPTQAPRTRRRG